MLGSGDMKIMEWDWEAGKKGRGFDGHNGDVAALGLKPEMEGGDEFGSVFVTGSVDRTVRLWDVRESEAKACQQVFWGHEADVNSVCFHPGGNNFVTCSEDKTSRLWDIRSDQVRD